MEVVNTLNSYNSCDYKYIKKLSLLTANKLNETY